MCIKMDANKFVITTDMQVEKNTEEIISNYIVEHDTSTGTAEQRQKLFKINRRRVKKERQGIEIEELERAKGWRDSHIKIKLRRLFGDEVDDNKLIEAQRSIEAEYKEKVTIYDKENDPHVFSVVHSGNGTHSSQALVVDTIIEGISKSKYKPIKKKLLQTISTKQGAEGIHIMAPLRQKAKDLLIGKSDKRINALKASIITVKKHQSGIDEHINKHITLNTTGYCIVITNPFGSFWVQLVGYRALSPSN